MSKQRGFTLLELLVAIAIFALLGVGSYRLLASTITTRDTARQHDAALMQLQKAFTVMNRDFSQVVSRSIRDEFGDKKGAVVLKNNTIEFTRAGWPNPLQQARSELQRISYEVNTKGELIRASWPQLDRERGTKPQQSIVLKGVEGIQIKATNQSGTLEGDWPSLQQQQAQGQAQANKDAALDEVPRGLEIIITVKPWGEIRRFFRLPQMMEVTKNAT